MHKIHVYLIIWSDARGISAITELSLISSSSSSSSSSWRPCENIICKNFLRQSILPRLHAMYRRIKRWVRQIDLSASLSLMHRQAGPGFCEWDWEYKVWRSFVGVHPNFVVQKLRSCYKTWNKTVGCDSYWLAIGLLCKYYTDIKTINQIQFWNTSRVGQTLTLSCIRGCIPNHKGRGVHVSVYPWWLIPSALCWYSWTD